MLGILRGLGSGVTYGCELPSQCRDLNPDPQQEQLEPLTTEPSLQLQKALLSLHCEQKSLEELTIQSSSKACL